MSKATAPKRDPRGADTVSQRTAGPHRSRRTRSEGGLSATPPVANPIPPLVFPEELPVSAKREEIARALRAHQVVIVSGETGSGKTTQLPKICLSIGRGLGAGGTGLIGHTQPRRLAATSVARRIAQEIGSPLGEHVGFKIRFNDQLSRGASVKLMTDGILLAETQTDPLLRAYDTIIIDEAHERSLNIDFLLGYLRQLLPRRPDLKLIVTSATIDAERFSKHFNDAPVVEVSGRTYPVEVRWRPPTDEQEQTDAIVAAVDELTALGLGDVLVFLPGEREIREAAEALRKHHPPHTEILPLFARLSAEEQDRIFKPSNTRRIVLATNVAETSLTVPGIRYVVDPGTARVKRYSYRQKVEQLQVEAVSQASANQRAGRCGRVSAGVCIRLYAQEDYSARPRFTDPEILRSSLAAVILRMKALRLDDIERFPFVEPPPGRAVADGYALLQELGALDERNALTDIGTTLAKLPLDPRIGRMLMAARDADCLSEATIIAAALSTQDPRERPFGQEEAADQAHRKFADEKSEFLGILKRWKFYEEALAHKKSNSKLREQLKATFLHPLRMREWRDVHGQLHSTLAELGWRFNETPAQYQPLHMALLTGLLGNIGLKGDDEPHYEGARGIKFYIWPGSSLAKKAGRWIVAAELVETSRLFARTVARVEPEWLERVGAHLLKRTQGDPHWDKRAGRISAFERATLYGLMVYHGRRVDYGRINPTHARELFIREALVAGEYEPKSRETQTLLAHNLKLVREIEQLEHKSRRLDVLVDDELIYAWYDAKLPHDVRDTHEFEGWYRAASRDEPKLLFLSRDDLMRHEAAGITTDVFPKTMQFGGIEMALSYHFEPGSPRDGVTLTVPLYALNVVDEARCEWLVPGMLKEKVQLLLKSLPQKLRRHFVPLPEAAMGFVDRISARSGEGLVDALRADMRETRQVVAAATDFKLETLPAHLFMNFKVVDEHGRQLGMERSLAKLRAELGREARVQFRQLVQTTVQSGNAKSGASENETSSIEANTKSALKTGDGTATTPLDIDMPISDWSFGELPELLEVRRGKQTLIGYPALVDAGAHARLEVFDDPATAAAQHRLGLRRLFAVQLKEPLKHLDRNIPNLTQLAVHFMPLGSQEELKRQILDLALERACMADPLPVDARSFHLRRDEGRGRLGLLVQEIGRLAALVLAEYAALNRKLPQAKSHAAAYADMTAQLSALMPRDFLVRHPYDRLAHLPRYLKAAMLRIDKLRADPTRDARSLAELQPLLTRYQRHVVALKGSVDARLTEFRWLLEELRVSLFAQELRTPMPVSVKRLQKVWESLS
ncbi:MAG TPA: ATP-dependent RNA helicase HrpA [Burkholderiaceae bacterium]|nr:ATP-dependent RNA helicase HrpA [Burkholderiaceae bacterium]